MISISLVGDNEVMYMDEEFGVKLLTHDFKNDGPVEFNGLLRYEDDESSVYKKCVITNAGDFKISRGDAEDIPGYPMN